MSSILATVMWAILAYICYKIAVLMYAKYCYARTAAAMGCKDAPTMPCADPFGIQTARDCMRAVRDECFPTFAIDTMDSISQNEGRLCTTFSLKLPPGSKETFTVDPRNIQAILALKFKDFKLPEMRLKLFAPLLGQGIVCLSLFVWQIFL